MQENGVQNQSLLQEKEDPELPDFLNWTARRICEKSPLWGNKAGSQLCHRNKLQHHLEQERITGWMNNVLLHREEEGPPFCGVLGATNSAARSKSLVPAPHPRCAHNCEVSQRTEQLRLTMMSLSPHPWIRCPLSVSESHQNLHLKFYPVCAPFSVSCWRWNKHRLCPLM